MEEIIYLKEMSKRHPELEPLEPTILKGFCLLRDCYRNGGKLLVCGNGGSAADADHIVGELMKGFHKKRELLEEGQASLGRLAERLQGALAAIALTQHTALCSALCNDVDPQLIFAQQVYGYGNPGDVLWAISTSGNAVSVVNAAGVAVGRGMKVLAMTGRGGGTLKKKADVCIEAPETDTAFVQEQHIIIYHVLCAMLEESFF